MAVPPDADACRHQQPRHNGAADTPRLSPPRLVCSTLSAWDSNRTGETTSSPEIKLPVSAMLHLCAIQMSKRLRGRVLTWVRKTPASVAPFPPTSPQPDFIPAIQLPRFAPPQTSALRAQMGSRQRSWISPYTYLKVLLDSPLRLLTVGESCAAFAPDCRLASLRFPRCCSKTAPPQSFAASFSRFWCSQSCRPKPSQRAGVCTPAPFFMRPCGSLFPCSDNCRFSRPLLVTITYTDFSASHKSRRCAG